MKKAIFGFSVKDIAEIAILCAIAIVLDSFIKIEIGATGGSLNIAMVPLYIIALRHGWFKSCIAGGLVFGLITCLLDGYGIATFPLEYLVAFGSVGILGIFGHYINTHFEKKNTKGIILSYVILIVCILVAAIIRLLCGSIDSVILWEYTWKEALAYNVTYVLPSAAAVAVIVCLMLPFIKVTNQSYPTSYLQYNAE